MKIKIPSAKTLIQAEAVSCVLMFVICMNGFAMSAMEPSTTSLIIKMKFNMTQNLQKLNHPPNSLSGLRTSLPPYFTNNLRISQKIKLLNSIML